MEQSRREVSWEELRARGCSAGQDTKLRTYAALAASGRGGARRSPASGGSGGSGSRTELAPGGPTTSAFFKLPRGDRLQQAPGTRQRDTPVIGSVTPPSSRPATRVAAATPESAASPFADADDDTLFQMSGLKPLRTSSRTAAAAVAAMAAAAMPGVCSQRKATQSTNSAPAMQAEARPAEAGLGPAAELDARHASSFPRAFTFTGEVSPRSGGHVPTVTAVGRLPAGAASAAGEAGHGIHVLSSSDRIRPAAVEAEADPVDGSPGSGAAAAAEAEVPIDGAPGWSEELLNWMLNEKAGLLLEAQRAARRQHELEAELDRLRARGSGAEREAQHLAAERRALLDRVQQLSAAEAEAAARAERLTVENDSLTAELERSQEVCREMLAARRAARDALSEMSAQNARLLAAYVGQKQEAAQLKEELRRQHRESEARIQALEAQLAAACALRHGLLGSLCPSPASPPQHAGSPCSEHSIDEGPQDGIATPTRLRPASSCDAGLPGGSFGDVGAEPSAASPPPDKENASRNTAANGRGSSRAQRACKEEWVEERSELLSLLERLQGQLEARAEQQAAAADVSPTAPMRSEQQPGCAGDGTEGCSQLPVGTPVAAQNQQQHVPGHTASSTSSGSSVEISLDSAGQGADGASPTVVAHHMAESPLPSTSAARSGAPSPASVHQQRSAPPAASPAAETRHAGAGEQTPVSRAPASEPVPAAQQGSSMQGQPGQDEKQQHKLSSSSGRTLDAFFGRSLSEAAAAAAPANAAVGQAAAAEQQRLQQAEMRAAELEVEVERLRAANAAAQEKMQREERRRNAESAKSAGNAAFQAQHFEEALQHYSRALETLASSSCIGSGAGGSSSSESIDAALAAVLHCNRAAAHQACGRYLHAVADCFRAEGQDPSYNRIYHRRADAYWAIGAWDAAAQDLGRLLKLGAGQDVAARLVEAQRRSQAGQPANHYSVLGLRPAATPGEVKVAYRQLARAFHPDKALQAGEGLSADAAHLLFKLLSEAAGVLGDAEQRRQHDIATLRQKYRRQYAAAF